MLRYVEIALLALIAVLVAYMIYGAASWDLEARLFPWVAGFPLLVLAIAQLAITIRSKAPGAVSMAASSLSPTVAPLDSKTLKETIRLGGWIAVFSICVALFSFPFGLPLAALLYLKLESHESWPLSLLLAGVTLGYLYLFDYGLHLPWPEGIVTGFLFPG